MKRRPGLRSVPRESTLSPPIGPRRKAGSALEGRGQPALRAEPVSIAISASDRDDSVNRRLAVRSGAARRTPAASSPPTVLNVAREVIRTEPGARRQIVKMNPARRDWPRQRPARDATPPGTVHPAGALRRGRGRRKASHRAQMLVRRVLNLARPVHELCHRRQMRDRIVSSRRSPSFRSGAQIRSIQVAGMFGELDAAAAPGWDARSRPAAAAPVVATSGRAAAEAWPTARPPTPVPRTATSSCTGRSLRSSARISAATSSNACDPS